MPYHAPTVDCKRLLTTAMYEQDATIHRILDVGRQAPFGGQRSGTGHEQHRRVAKGNAATTGVSTVQRRRQFSMRQCASPEYWRERSRQR